MSLHDERQERFSRLLLIYHLLEINSGDRRLTRRDLQTACGCSPKTVQRDLKFLEEAGAQIRFCRSRRSYLLERPLPHLEVRLSWASLVALALAQKGAAAIGATPLTSAAQHAFSQLTAKLPSAMRDELHSVEGVLEGEASRRRYSGDILQSVIGAAQRRETIAMTYYSIGRDQLSTRRADPYSLSLRDGVLTLIAHCHTRREVRMFSLDGIRHIEPTRDKFTIPQDWSPSKYLEGVVGGMRGEVTRVEVRFDASIARWARRLNWEFPHRFTSLPDGALLLRGEVANLSKFSKELLRWGAGVEALHPPRLRALMQAEAAAIARRYEDEAGIGEKDSKSFEK